MNMKKSILLGVALSAFAGFAAEVKLVENGVAKCRVVVADDARPALKFGAREIEKYLAQATGCEKGLGVRGQGLGDENLIPVRVSVDDGLVKSGKLREDGFILDVKPTGIDVIGANPRGALYGCYEILKKYAGMRWIMPGEDGEYCVLKGKTVAVPVGRSVHNPYLKIRKTVADGEIAWLWHARNNMTCETSSRNFENPKTGKPTDKAARLTELCVKGVGTAGNSHIMMDMMCGWAGKGTKAAIDTLFAAHPEYFPLVRGQRIPIYDAGDPNPCVSNPELLDLMAKNLYEHIKGPHGSEDYVTIGNNDTTVWCECEKCRALDAPELAGTKGARADRYWHTVGEIAKRIWAVDATVKLGGWAYQDFWYPPAKVKLDPRLRAFISFNNQCWRHAVDDPKCTVNAEWRNIFKAWAKTGHPLVCNRDEIGCNGSPGSSYAPVEDVLRKNFLAYPEYGCAGSSFCVYAPFQHPHLVNKAPYFGKADRWHGMWQTCYMSARMMWDPKGCDFDAELEEACRLFYGEAAWNGGMKEFRALHKKAWFETPGCYGWGLGSPLGRCLDQAGVEERLVALMDAAVKAAEASGDARAIAHVRRERDVFACTWLHERKAYLESFKELTAYRKQGEIRIDGVLDEADWANADALGNFKAGGHTPAGTKVEQSVVRVVYDPEALYISVECLEPTPEKMIAADRLEDEGAARYRNFGSHVEIFYNYPDMFDKYYHLMVNAKGLVMSAIQLSGTQRDNSFRTSAKVATKVLKDRWIAEIAIPTSEIGMKCFDGATWKLNVGRIRKLTGVDGAPETSSCCNGAFHGAANFVNVKFAPSRAKGLYQSAQVSAWENSGFEASVSNAKINRHYRWNAFTFPADNDLVPAKWFGGGLCGEYLEENGGHFMRIRPGKGSYLSQYFVSDAPGKARISFRIRGTGKVALWTALYTDTPTKRGYRLQDGTSKNEVFTATGDWQTVTVDRAKNGKPTERMAVRFTAQKDSEIDIDDVVVSPIGEE